MDKPFRREDVQTFVEWGKRPYDKNNPKHVAARKTIKGLYGPLKAWGTFVQKALFPRGKLIITEKAIDASGIKFRDYLWALIYPTTDAPEELAYMVFLRLKPSEPLQPSLVYPSVCFEVLLGIQDGAVSKAQKNIYYDLYNKYERDKLVVNCSVDEGCNWSLDELTAWACKSIQGFLPYDTVKKELGLSSSGKVLEEPDKKEAAMKKKVNEGMSSDELRTKPRNIIYYGPPGTGKTYKLLEERKKYSDNGKPRYEVVTFHQSYGYEEFVEGLRPVLNDGLKSEPAIAPASPAMAESPTTSSQPNDGHVRYEIKTGVFRKLCERAEGDQENRYAIFIDEVNRGNISKIFGELITLIEPDKRAEVHVTLPYSGKRFTVPRNVDVIGTMNTADRSLALLDVALRRRFEFEEMMPDLSYFTSPVIEINGVKMDVRNILDMLNRRIEAIYDRDHTIGHAYFKDVEEAKTPAAKWAALQHTFRTMIVPLLKEYFFDDLHKIHLVLGDNQKTGRQYQFFQARNEGWDKLFGSDDITESSERNPQYQLNEAAFGHPEAYVQIYARHSPMEA